MTYEDIDLEGYEEGLAAIDMASYDTILMLKIDSVDSAKAFITQFVEEAGVELEYTEGDDGSVTFSAEVEGDISTTVEGSIDAEHPDVRNGRCLQLPFYIYTRLRRHGRRYWNRPGHADYGLYDVLLPHLPL